MTMKKIYNLLLSLLILFTGCSLQEEPPFLANENVYSSPDNAKSALNGIYQGMMNYEMYANVYPFLNGLYSGMMLSKRGGNNVNTTFNSTLGILSAPSGELNMDRVWGQIYVAIGRANDAINSAVITENPQTEAEMVINDVIGQAHFVRAFNYFNLVNFWGEVPLRLVPTTLETIHLAKSSKKEIYDQILLDIQKALALMNGSTGESYPKVYAVNMLLSKVYMNLATAPVDIQDGVTDYWQAAYDEAIKVYGHYTLVDDYSSLFNEATSDGNSENIFELQSSDGASHDWVRAFTPSNYTKANTFGWLQVNADFYDLHVSTYPTDPRLQATFISSYTQQNNNVLFKTYPDVARNSFAKAHPYFFKFSEKDPTNESQVGNQNVVIYRYAELLIMLAEISNELQNGDQLNYVTELLSRVGLSPHSGFSGTQDEFRHAIMREYQFELIGEGQDVIHTRRRGYTWFKETVIDFHNNNPLFDPNVDVMHSDDESVVMHLPIPDAEVNTNQKIEQ